MCHLDHQVAVIFVKQVFADPGSLHLPVQPDTQRAVVDVIMYYLYVYGSVELDPGNFISEEFMLYCNIINMIVIDFTEYTAQMAYDSVLAAVIDGVIGKVPILVGFSHALNSMTMPIKRALAIPCGR